MMWELIPLAKATTQALRQPNTQQHGTSKEGNKEELREHQLSYPDGYEVRKGCFRLQDLHQGPAHHQGQACCYFLKYSSSSQV